MKTLFLIAAMAVTATFNLNQAVAKDGDVHEKVIPISDVYIPNGFDSGSDAFLVVNGWFPHSCYKLRDVQVSHVGPTLHQVTTVAAVTEGLCLTVIVPFHREVQIGKLAVGTHQIQFMNGDGTYMEKQLVIEQ